MNDEYKDDEHKEGWNSWKIYVIKTLDKLDRRQTETEKEHKKEEISSAKDITEIKTRMKMSSAVISIIVALVIGLLVNVFSAYLISNWIEKKYEVDISKEVSEILEEKTDE